MDNYTLAKELELTVYNSGKSREVTHGYSGDFLSWVLAKVDRDCVWLTVMNNVNVAAVATLKEVSCVVLTDSVKPDAMLLKKASEAGLMLCGSDKNSFSLANDIGRLLGGA